MKLTLELTEAQERMLTTCADAARAPLDRWILECAIVKAANIIDVLQEDARRQRAETRALNARSTAASARLPRQPRARSAPQDESRILKAARAYNAEFRASKPPRSV